MKRIIPTKKTFMHIAKTGLKGGITGGLAVGLCSTFLGPTLGGFAGGIIGGALMGGSVGEVIAINGVMDGTISLFMGTGAAGGTM